MTAETVLRLKNSVNGKFDPDIDAPNFVKLTLNASTVDMLERALRLHESAAEIYGVVARVRNIELDFPSPALEYIQHHLSGPKPWSGNVSMPSLALYSDGIQFIASPYGPDVSFTSELVTYDRLRRELRNWRARELGQVIDDAMPGDDAPAQSKKSSGMTPL